MEYALSEFFENGDKTMIAMRTGIARLFEGKVADPEYHTKNFFRQLIAVNPLRINSVTHSPFWYSLKVYIDRSLESYKESEYETKTREFVIILNKGEMVYKLRHHEALQALLCAIMSKSLNSNIQSVYNIPEHILVAFLKRKELRKMFYDRFANHCEDRLDVYNFHDRGLITDFVLFDTLDEQADLKAQDCYVTPPPELDESAVQLPSKPSDIDTTKLIFPERPVLPEFLGASRIVIQHTLAFYSYLWSEASKAVESVRYQCKVAHGSECRCAEKILNMRVLLPLLRACVEQSIDLKTVVRQDVRHFFSISAPLFEVLDPLVANIYRYLSGGPATPELDIFLHNHTTVAEMMERDIRKVYTDGKHSVFTFRTTEVPLKLLLRELDSEFLFASSLPLLRGFLANRDRKNYIAYLLPKEVGFFDLRVTVALINDKFGLTFGNLRNILPLQAISGVYMVCKPGDMTTLRCLMMSERIIENAMNNTVNVPTTLDLPQACVLLRNFLMRANELSLEVQRASALSLARMMDFYLSRDPRNGGQIFSDGNPQNREILNLFKYIPKVCHVLQSHFEPIEARFDILKSFLRQNSLHTCNRMVLSNFLYKLERRLDDDSPYRKIVEKIKKVYKSKLGNVAVKEGQRMDFEVQISRRKDPEVGHIMMYKLLLDSGVFVDAEIAEYLQALALKGSATTGTKPTPRNMVGLSKDYKEEYQKFQKSGDDPTTIYTDNICEYWNRASFSTSMYARQELVENATCPSRDSSDQLLQHTDLELHYEASLFGHTFRPVRQDSGDMLQPTVEEIRSLADLMSFLEFRYHTSESIEPNQDHTIFTIIYSERPLCMPIVAEPRIHFENSFFVYVGAEWPLPVDASFDVISDGGDLAISQKRNIMDHVAEHCRSWRPSNRVTQSSGVNATYSACLVAAQKAFV